MKDFLRPQHLQQRWAALTEPAASVTDPEQRRLARLLASLLLAIILFVIPYSAAVIIARSVIAAPIALESVLMALVISFLLACYRLSRAGYYQNAVLVLVVVGSGVIFALAEYREVSRDLRFLSYLSIAILFGIQFFSLRESLVFIAAELGAVALYGAVVGSAGDR